MRAKRSSSDAVAVERHHQRAVGDGAGIGLTPQRDAAFAQIPDDGLGAFLLAARREHGAGIGTAGVGERLGRALVERDVVTGSRQASAPATGRRRRRR